MAARPLTSLREFNRRNRLMRSAHDFKSRLAAGVDQSGYPLAGQPAGVSEEMCKRIGVWVRNARRANRGAIRLDREGR